MNQTFYTSAEPSPESSEPAASFNPPPPWGDNVPSRFTPTSQWEKDLRSTVQAAFSDAPEPQETPVSIPYSNFPVFTPSNNKKEEWPQKSQKGTKKREKFEQGYEEFKLGFLLQQARLEKGLTQEALAEKCGTNKGYISKVENNIKDVRISTLQKIVEIGLGGHLQLSIKV